MHPKSQPEEQIRLPSNLLVLSTTLLHVYCRNPRWRKPQMAYCLSTDAFRHSCSKTSGLLLWSCSQQSGRHMFYLL